MARLIAERDFGDTALGPIEEWPDALVGALEMILHSEFQLAIYWGPELILLYNDAERAPLGDLHPQALGQPARVVLHDFWDEVGPMLEGVLATGRPTWSEDAPLLLRRWDLTEEVFFTWSYSPIFGASGKPEGVLLISTETTERVLNERRLRGLYAVAKQTANLRSLEEVWSASVESLVEDSDILIAELYVVAEEVVRVASAGRPEELRGVSSRLVAETAASGEVTVRPPLEDGDGETYAAILIPFNVSCLSGAVPVLVLALNPYRRIGQAKLDYAQMLAGQIAAAANNTAAVEQEQSRARHEAAGEERKRIGRDLHDSIQRQLVGARLITEATRDLVSSDPVGVGRLLGELSDQLSTAAVELRQVVAGQYPSRLRTQGLVAAIRAAAEGAGLAISVEGDVGRLEEPTEIELYHAVIEAVQNAFKHGGSGCRVGVRFRRGRERVVALVHDSGPGFDPASVVRGDGLRNMEDRLRSLSGTCQVRSAVGSGTSVRFTCPSGSPDRSPATREPKALAS